MFFHVWWPRLLGTAQQEVLTWRQIDVALKADAFLTELESGSDDQLPKMAGAAQWARVIVEGRTAWAVSETTQLTPMFEIGGRWDEGKAETGVGAEHGGGFAYAHTKLGLGIEAGGGTWWRARKRCSTGGGESDAAGGGAGKDKRGLWLSLAPTWGADASQVEQL